VHFELDTEALRIQFVDKALERDKLQAVARGFAHVEGVCTHRTQPIDRGGGDGCDGASDSTQKLAPCNKEKVARQ